MQHAGRGQAEEDVGAGDHVGEAARVRVLGVAVLARIHLLLAAAPDDAEPVGRDHVLDLEPHVDEKIEAGDRRGARARGDELHLAKALADEAQRVADGGADDDRGAVLVVVEHRDFHARPELRFDLEAFGRLHVLEIDRAERGLERGDHIDEPAGIALVDLEVEHVDAGEFLEEDGLSFHHRFRCERADRAEAEDGRAVRHDGDEVGARGEGGRLVRVLGNCERGRGHARRIGQRQVVLRGERLRRDDRDLSRRRQAVIFERAAALVFGHVQSLPLDPAALYHGEHSLAVTAARAGLRGTRRAHILGPGFRGTTIE